METPRETIARLIRTEFDKCTSFWQINDARAYISTAKSYGLDELASEMENDLKI